MWLILPDATPSSNLIESPMSDTAEMKKIQLMENRAQSKSLMLFPGEVNPATRRNN
jgi:hypothetical protein